MTKHRKRVWPAALCSALVALAAAAPAWGAASDPLFVLTPAEPGPPRPIPPPTGYLDGPCGLAVTSSGSFYLSDYYHQAVDVFSSSGPYGGQPLAATSFTVSHTGPVDDPCALALDGAGTLYINNLHRNVVRFPSPISLGTGTVIAGAPLDSSHPTGVAVDPATNDVYVNDRTYITAYDSSGAPIEESGQPLQIGLDSLADYYGLAISAFPGTAGRIYVPDATTDTVKVYDPALDKVNPVATITGPPGGFTSLRDSAVAVDRASGNVYVADNLQPAFTEEPQAQVDVFSPADAYLGVLKYKIVDALPPGLAVDNSAGFTQGRVYVTSGNTVEASVYAYPPGAQTGFALPATLRLGVATSGTGGGVITSGVSGIDCATACEKQIRAGAEVSLTATPNQGSAFAGWSGGGCSGTGDCTVQMSEATSVSATFEALPQPSSAVAVQAAGGAATASGVAQKGSLRLSVSGKLAPHKLPRDGTAPIAVSVGWKVATTDGSAVPALKKLRIEINRHGRFDNVGLPICPYDRIQPASSARALAACRSALVGQGSFTADIALKGQEPYATQGRLLVFNGKSHGRSVLFGQIYSPHPFATSFVITFTLDKLGHGTYGTALEASLPKGLAAWGNLTGIEMKLSRRYGFRGKRHSFISSGCPAPAGFSKAVFPLARASFGFEGAKKLSSVLTSTCKVNR